MINWKIRIKNKAFWLMLIPALILLVEAVGDVFGLQINLSLIGEQLANVIEAVFLVLAILGIVNDPTTVGLSDSTQALSYTKPKDDGEDGEDFDTED